MLRWLRTWPFFFFTISECVNEMDFGLVWFGFFSRNTIFKFKYSCLFFKSTMMVVKSISMPGKKQNPIQQKKIDSFRLKSSLNFHFFRLLFLLLSSSSTQFVCCCCFFDCPWTFFFHFISFHLKLLLFSLTLTHLFMVGKRLFCLIIMMIMMLLLLLLLWSLFQVPSLRLLCQTPNRK